MSENLITDKRELLNIRDSSYDSYIKNYIKSNCIRYEKDERAFSTSYHSYGNSSTYTWHKTYEINGSIYNEPFFFSPMLDIDIQTQGGIDISCTVEFQYCVAYRFKEDGSIQTFKSGDSDLIFKSSMSASYPYGENFLSYMEYIPTTYLIIPVGIISR